MAPTDEINELNLDDLTEQDGPDESQDDNVDNDPDAPDVDNDVAPKQPDSGDPDEGATDDSPNIPGQIPQGTQDDNQLVHQALVYAVRTLQELAQHVANLDSNYAGLASELKSFLSSFVGRIETVGQNNGVNQSQADSLESNPTQQGRFQY